MEQFAKIPLRAARSSIGTRALRVLIAIGAHAGPNHTAFPGLQRIADLTGIERCKVPGAIEELEREGLLRRQRRGGRGLTNNYIIVFDDAETVPAAATVSGGETVAAVATDNPQNSGRRGVKTVATVAQNSGRRGVKQLSRRQPEQSLTDHNRPREHRDARASNGHDRDEVREADAIAEHFAQLWELFPRQRRTNRKQALASYRKIILHQTATADELLNAMQRYAVSDDVARGFACMPTTWLNQERWKLDWRPARPDTGQRRGSLVEAALREVHRDDG